MSDCEEMDFYPARLDLEKIKRAQMARRWIGAKEMKRRGCEFCLHMIHVGHLYISYVNAAGFSTREIKPNSRIHFCAFKTCPFRELDGIEKDYIKEYDSKLAKGLDTAMKCLRNMGVKDKRKAKAVKAVKHEDA